MLLVAGEYTDCPCTVRYTLFDYISPTTAAPEPQSLYSSSNEPSHNRTAAAEVLGLVVVAAGLACSVPNHLALTHGLTFPVIVHFAIFERNFHPVRIHAASRHRSLPYCTWPRHQSHAM